MSKKSSTSRTAAFRPLADVLFQLGFGTRHECAGLALSGSVSLLGKALTDIDAPIPTSGAVLRIDEQDWPVTDHVLVLLHKPTGYECSQKPSAWPSVMGLLPPPLRRRNVQPIGRLDQDTTGVLLLTDDGALIHRLTHPRKHVAKVYEVTCARPIEPGQVERLCAGVVLNDDPKPVRAAACEIVDPTHLRLTLTEGKYHQVKRMVAAVGNHVEVLHRSAFGPVTLPEGLPAGRWCWLPPDLFSGAKSPEA